VQARLGSKILEEAMRQAAFISSAYHGAIQQLKAMYGDTP
jgi:hypothetical protein